MGYEYVIIAVLPEPFQTQLVQLRKKYDRWTKSTLPSHITIIPPFRALPGAIKKHIFTTRYTLNITFQGWQSFHHLEHSVLWLDPGQEELRSVSKELRQKFPELEHLDSGQYRGGRDSVYHVTVANNIPDNVFQSVWDAVQSQTVEGSCNIEELSVFVRTAPNGGWEQILQP